MGDPHSGFPAPFVVSALKKSVTLDEEPIESTYSALAKILPSRSLSLLVDHAVDPAVFNYLNRNFYGGALRSFPWAEEISDDVSSFIAEYIDTTGKVSDHTFITAMGLLRVGMDTLASANAGTGGAPSSVKEKLDKMLRV